jgi:hypothetical protein
MLSNVKLSSVKVDYYDPDRVRFLIEQYCTEHKIKKAEYAVLIGLRPESLSRVIAGKGSSPETLAKIAALGNVSVKDLVVDAPAGVKEQLRSSGKKHNLPVCV